jgi:micrococcal nuclease
LLALVVLLAMIATGCAAPGATTRSSPAAPAPTTSAPEPGPASLIGASRIIQATVSRNVDGDTLHVRTSAGVTEKVRFIGVNTPESTIKHQPYGKEASNYTKRRLPVGTRVWLETDVGLRDRYGRLLAYVWLAPPVSGDPAEVRAKMFNAELLIEGYAQLMTIPPDVKYADAFVPLQSEARDASRGLWGLPAK